MRQTKPDSGLEGDLFHTTTDDESGMTSFASSFYRSCVFTSVVVTLLLAFCNGQQVLLADYTFEQSSILPFSGVCPFPAFLASPSSTGGTLSFVGGLSGLGTALNSASTSSPYVSTYLFFSLVRRRNLCSPPRVLFAFPSKALRDSKSIFYSINYLSD